MKTVEDIVKKCQTPDSMFGVEEDALLSYVPFAQARPLLKDEVTEDAWNKVYRPLTVKNVIADMEDYMDFAWNKVQYHRGLSTERSVEKMQEWLWLLDDTELLPFAEDDSNYANYGAPVLMKICQKYGFAIPDDEGIRRMAQGKPCYDGCEGGCG